MYSSRVSKCPTFSNCHLQRLEHIEINDLLPFSSQYYAVLCSNSTTRFLGFFSFQQDILRKSTLLHHQYRNKYAIYAYTHGPVTGSGFLEANTVV